MVLAGTVLEGSMPAARRAEDAVEAAAADAVTARCADDDMAAAAALKGASAARRADQDTVATVADAVTARSADHGDATTLAVAADPATGRAFASSGAGSPAAMGAPPPPSPLQRPATARSWWTERQGWRRRRAA
jgi:hypothetical protein